MIQAKVIADSEIDGQRITTVEATMHRYVLAELNTHRVFSRNSASSRAIPIAKQLKRVKTDTAWPVEWGSNQSGMQAGEPLVGFKAWRAKRAWTKARNAAVRQAKKLEKIGVHKQVTNRLLEPFMWHTIIITSTEWENFFSQRCSPLAQPEIRVAAEAIRDAIRASTPQATDVHLPYLQPDEHKLPLAVKIKICAARCARVSYLTQDGKRNTEKDLELFERLTTAKPPHWSPLEHVAFYAPVNIPDGQKIGDTNVPSKYVNIFQGNFGSFWGQLRHNLMVLKDIENNYQEVS